MNRNFIVLILSLFFQLADTYYFNLGQFLKPILEPTEDAFGSALKSDK